MPSGACFALALRGIVEPLLDTSLAPLPIDGYTTALGAAIRAASPASGSARAAILSEGPGSGAWFEHRALAEALDVPLVLPDELEPSGERLFARVGRERLPIDVLYRRLDDDRLSRAGRLTDSARGAARCPPCAAARCAASTPSAPGSPTTSSPTPTSRT